MPDASQNQKLKVFVSYSRRDSTEFADELVAGLGLAGFAPSLDRHDISAGEDWEARLGGLIQEADTIVFVVSPESVKSERCAWEIDRTLALSKRLLPVIFRPVPDTDVPAQLRRLQFVRFDTGPGITRALAQLAQALRQDISWIREHTRLGDVAARWQLRGRPVSMLLRGDDVGAARRWMQSRREEAPPITDLQHAFIESSEEAELQENVRSRQIRRQTIRIKAFVGILLMGVLGGSVYAAFSYGKSLKMRFLALADAVSPMLLEAEAEQSPRPGKVFRECRNCPEMVILPKGKFVMGSQKGDDDEKPAHDVTIGRAFAVSRFEVTFDQWDVCVVLGGCESRSAEAGSGGSKPVVNVNWYDADQYVRWLSAYTGKQYRLLSESEWEYAARAGSNTIYSWGNEIGRGNANCAGCGTQWSNDQTAPVGSFAPNAFGLSDMYGNVWEWVQDCYDPSYNHARADGSPKLDGECSLRVIRGGSWDFGSQFLRATLRLRDALESRRGNLGFRVARTLGP